jgi:6,7-dimethyl-8-ribityllumazine synthase
MSSQPRLAIIVSQFNENVTHGLLRGAKEYLGEQGITVPDNHIYSAPGAFEIPLLAQTLAKSDAIDGVICLGCVIKGDTAHFEYISETTGHGLLTTYTDEQAIVRSRNDKHNKGREAAAACVESIRTLRLIAGVKA